MCSTLQQWWHKALATPTPMITDTPTPEVWAYAVLHCVKRFRYPLSLPLSLCLSPCTFLCVCVCIFFCLSVCEWVCLFVYTADTVKAAGQVLHTKCCTATAASAQKEAAPGAAAGQAHSDISLLWGSLPWHLIHVAFPINYLPLASYPWPGLPLLLLLLQCATFEQLCRIALDQKTVACPKVVAWFYPAYAAGRVRNYLAYGFARRQQNTIEIAFGQRHKMLHTFRQHLEEPPSVPYVIEVFVCEADWNGSRLVLTKQLQVFAIVTIVLINYCKHKKVFLYAGATIKSNSIRAAMK